MGKPQHVVVRPPANIEATLTGNLSLDVGDFGGLAPAVSSQYCPRAATTIRHRSWPQDSDNLLA